MIILGINKMKQDKIEGHQAAGKEPCPAVQMDKDAPLFGKHIAAQQDKSPAPAVGRIEKPVEHLPEKGEQKEYNRYNSQYLKKPVSLCKEKGNRTHENNSREPHPAGITASLGSKEHYG